MSEQNKITASALKLSIATAFFLACIKLAAAWLTHSMAILASALDSMMDIASSLVNLIAARKAVKPPDENHAYGHGKIESLASLFQSMIVGLSGCVLIFEACKRLINGTTVEVIPVGLGVMAFSIMVTLLLIWRLQVMAKRNGSLILGTEKLHYTSDVVANGGAIAALILVQLTQQDVWDLVISIGISFFVFKASLSIFRTAVDELLDRSLPEIPQSTIETMIREQFPQIVGVHNFRSRRAREKIFLDFHIEIRSEENFLRAHQMTEALIAKVEERYPGADITVHYDPEGEI